MTTTVPSGGAAAMRPIASSGQCGTTVTVTAAAGVDRHDHARRLMSAAANTAGATIRTLVARLDSELGRVCGYHLGWVDATGAATAGSGGKALRPALALAGAGLIEAGDGVGGRCAAAVELLHNFTLVHDDVMDGDATPLDAAGPPCGPSSGYRRRY